MRSRSAVAQRIALVVALAAAAVLVASGEAWRGFMALSGRLEATFQAAGPGGAAAFVVLAAMSVLLSVFTSAPLVPAAVLAWGRAGTFGLLLVGWLLGGLGAYAVGRWGGRRLLGRFVALDRLDRWMTLLPRRRSLALATLVRMTFPSEVAYVFGVLRYRLTPFVVLTLLAEAPTAWILVTASEALVRRRLGLLAVVTGAAAVLLVAAWRVRDTLLARRAPPPTSAHTGAGRSIPRAPG